MIDHVLGRPSEKSRRLQVLAVLAFWSAYLFRGHRHGPLLARFVSKFLSKKLTAWQIVVVTMIYLYAARNFSTLVGLASPDPLANMYDAAYFRATWVLTALDAGFWTAMKIRRKWLRDLASIVFSVFYLFSAEKADEKVRKVRANLTLDHLRVSWNKGTTPYIKFLQDLMTPRLTKWPPRMVRIPRPPGSDYKEPVMAWLYYDGSLDSLRASGISRVVLDVPGGGFVAMDPRCNDARLWSWAVHTGLPVLSLDYKKAPEYPYPHALNEAYDTYVTLVRTRGRCIGLAGREVPRIVVCGDSAGGNLATAMTLMIAETGGVGAGGGGGEGGGSPGGRFSSGRSAELPMPDGLVLFYPALDMNIGNWMSDEQMALIKDRRTRAQNKDVIRRKSMQYSHLACTPHESDDEGGGGALTADAMKAREDGEDPEPGAAKGAGVEVETEAAVPRSSSQKEMRTPHPEYSHNNATSFDKTVEQPSTRATPAATATPAAGASYHPQPLHTRLAMSSMISYTNDRVLTPEMMRAMIILYVGPHNRPDFSQDYHLSPVLAPDILLAHFPKTYFLTGERDPLVDDTVIFAGRLRRVKAAYYASGGRRLEYRGEADDAAAAEEGFDGKRDAAEVVLIPKTSHGFMQFPTVYPPAWDLMERAARWIEDSFAAADARRRRERERRRAAAAALRSSVSASMKGVNGVNGAGGRRHVRTESSGDEDGPLEMRMSMTRARGKTGGVPAAGATKGEKGASKKEQEEGAAKAGGEEEMTNGTSDEAVAIKSNSNRKRRARGRDREKDDRLVKLASSDDLLGRRMQGLAGGLTGVGEE